MTARRILYVVEDEAIVRASIVSLVEAHGDFECRQYASGEMLLERLPTLDPGCFILDLQLEGRSGMQVMNALSAREDRFRMIVITGFGDLALAVEAYRAGAVDFLYKPYEMRLLLDGIDRAFHLLEHGVQPPGLIAEAKARLARLGAIESRVLAMLVQGRTNGDIADALALDPRVVQVHRARALAMLDAPSILAAIRTTVIAGWSWH